MIWCDEFQRQIITLQDDLALIFEVDCNAGAYDRLNLAEAPIRLVPVADDGANFEEYVLHWPM